MLGIYGVRWANQFSTKEMRQAAILEWYDSLKRYSAEQIDHAIGDCKKPTSHYKAVPPTLPQFVELCELFRKTDTVHALPGEGCIIFEYGHVCNRPRFAAMHWCEKHYDERRIKNDIDREIERRNQTTRQAIRDSRVSGNEFYRDQFGIDPEKIAKRLVGKK